MTIGRHGVAAGFLSAAIVVACGGSVEVSSTPGVAASGPTASASPSVAPQSSPPAPTGSVSPAPSGSATGPIAYDEDLLAVLPEEVAGVAIVSDPDAAAAVGQDRTLGLAADRVAFGIASDTATGELAVAAVVHLRVGVFGAPFYRSYRDTYDAAACAPAGGVIGHAEAVVLGRTTYIATCGGGAHTYHVYLAAPSVIVSIVAVGEQKELGQAIVEGLRG